MEKHITHCNINSILRYGTEPGREKARLVRHALRGLARRAWAREQDIVSGAATGETGALGTLHRSGMFLILCQRNPIYALIHSNKKGKYFCLGNF